MSSRAVLACVAALSIVVSACGGSTPTAEPSGVPSVAPASPSTAAAPTCVDEPFPSPDGVTTWWRDAVFYEVFVRSFADSNGDGIGDLRGLTERLDYLNDGDPSTTNDLGVTALWLMPVAESPSYHGYDVTDYLAVEPDYGTAEDFRALVSAAEARGIRIIVDLVMNHTSVEHPWFQDARTRGSEHDDWYVWSDEAPTVSGPGGRPVWHADGGRWYYGYFWEGMPDLNLTNDDVTAALDSVGRFWLDDMSVDGFRLDAARHLIEDGSTLENTDDTFAWLEDFRGRTKQAKPTALVLGEVWDATSIASRYVDEGALDLTFDFSLASQFLQAVRNGDAESLRIIREEVASAYPVGGYAAFLTNHDQDRTFDVVGRDVAKAKQAATMLLTDPGVPFLYYGEEVGLRGRKPDERIRTPMPWTGEAPGYGFTDGEPWEAMAEDVDTMNVTAETDDADSLLSWYRSLIALRADEAALRGGAPALPVAASERTVSATLRHDPAGSSVVIVSNLGDEPVSNVTLSLDEGPLCGVPAASVALGADRELAAPTVNAAGGFDAWPIGDLASHEDLIVGLSR
jgi:glycosidase